MHYFLLGLENQPKIHLHGTEYTKKKKMGGGIY